MTDETQGAGFEGGEGDDKGFVVDMSGVDESGTYELLPRGKYAATVSNLTFDYSQSGGNPMWTWELELVGDADNDYAGRKFYYHTTFTEKGMSRVKRALIRVGEVELANDPAMNPQEVADSGVLIGKDCVALLGTQRYEQQMRNNVKDLLPASEAGGEFVSA